MLGNTVGAMATFANGTFTSTLTHVTVMTITSVATGTVSQIIDRYTLQCLNGDGDSGDADILTPGKVILETNSS